MMQEIRERMEARKVARDLEIARSTIDELKSEKSKKEAEKKAGGKRGSKKANATQSAPGIIDAVPLVSVGAVARKFTPESTLSKDVVLEGAPTRGRGNKPTVEKGCGDNALSTLKFGSIAVDGLSRAGLSGDAEENALGIALVATALGKKVPRSTPTHNVVGISDCYVELPSLRKKAKNQVSVVAPPNSIESDEGGRGDAGSELRLNQPDVHIGFPGDVCGTIEKPEYSESVVASPEKVPEPCSVATILEGDVVELFDIAMTGAAASGGTPDAPTVIIEIAVPVPELTDAAVINQPFVLSGEILMPAPNVMAPGSAEEKKAMKDKYDLKQKMLREIAASQLLQEELARTNPNLLSVTSFMNSVCGMDRGTRLLKEMAESVIQKDRVEKLAAKASIQKETAGDEAGFIHTFGFPEEIVEGVIGVTTLAEPTPQITEVAPESRVTGASEGAIIAESRGDGLNTGDDIVSGGSVGAPRTKEADVVSLDDSVMSIGGSSSEDSTDHSTCGSSVSASESRKRAADASPEREREESSRRDFPGHVTRCMAGCRVYIPPVIDDREDCPGRVLNDDGTIR